MTHRERFFATVANQTVDRPASWLGLPVPSAEPELFRYFGVNTIEELKLKLDDDIFPIEVPYNFPPANHIACAFKFAKVWHDDKPDERTLTAPGFFEDYDDPADVEKFPWPDPALYLDVEESRRRVKAINPDYIRMGVMWSAHFQDACAAFGMETALMNMMLAPELFMAVTNRIVDFYLKANEIFYQATRGKLHAVLIGNDLGSQNGLMVDPDSIRTFVLPGTRKLVAQAKRYGLRVIHHSCGSIHAIIPDLIDCGVDAIHPIQALATHMEPERLKVDFGDQVAFCGGVDAQYLLVKGQPDDVTAKVEDLRRIFPTGLIISPSHEAILPDIPPANIEALFKAANR